MNGAEHVVAGGSRGPDEPAHTTGKLAIGKGRAIFFRQWTPGPRGRLLVVHGLGESSGRYTHVGDFFHRAGYEVMAVDLPGHGRSDGRRGDFGSYEVLAAGLDAVLAVQPLARTVVLAHSFGAQLALWSLPRSRHAPRGLIASAPWLELTKPAGAALRRFALAVRRFWPLFPFPTGISGQRVSADQAFLDALPDRELRIPFIRVQSYFEAERAAAEVMREARCPVPVLVAHGGQDDVTSLAATEAYFARLQAPAKTLKVYPGRRHELHNDLGRDAVLADYLEWARLALGSPEAK